MKKKIIGIPLKKREVFISKNLLTLNPNYIFCLICSLQIVFFHKVQGNLHLFLNQNHFDFMNCIRRFPPSRLIQAIIRIKRASTFY